MKTKDGELFVFGSFLVSMSFYELGQWNSYENMVVAGGCFLLLISVYAYGKKIIQEGRMFVYLGALVCLYAFYFTKSSLGIDNSFHVKDLGWYAFNVVLWLGMWKVVSKRESNLRYELFTKIIGGLFAVFGLLNVFHFYAFFFRLGSLAILLVSLGLIIGVGIVLWKGAQAKPRVGAKRVFKYIFYTILASIFLNLAIQGISIAVGVNGESLKYISLAASFVLFLIAWKSQQKPARFWPLFIVGIQQGIFLSFFTNGYSEQLDVENLLILGLYVVGLLTFAKLLIVKGSQVTAHYFSVYILLQMGREIWNGVGLDEGGLYYLVAGLIMGILALTWRKKIFFFYTCTMIVLSIWMFTLENVMFALVALGIYLILNSWLAMKKEMKYRYMSIIFIVITTVEIYGIHFRDRLSLATLLAIIGFIILGITVWNDREKLAGNSKLTAPIVMVICLLFLGGTVWQKETSLQQGTTITVALDGEAMQYNTTEVIRVVYDFDKVLNDGSVGGTKYGKRHIRIYLTKDDKGMYTYAGYELDGKKVMTKETADGIWLNGIQEHGYSSFGMDTYYSKENNNFTKAVIKVAKNGDGILEELK